MTASRVADLAEAFINHPGSEANFENFPHSVKRGILERIIQAKRPETRAKRVRETAELATHKYSREPVDP
ncbi:hypothetical protein C7271_06640 [filamentous cyanobacterium CCP5]|nr:hypothetical protein C7271_06640 [filamentous cyanobacterium CCP5]